MTAVAIAKRPLTVQYDGEGPQQIAAGEIVPRFDEWHPNTASSSLGAGNVELVTAAAIVAEVAASEESYRDDLFAALRAHGYQVSRSKPRA